MKRKENGEGSVYYEADRKKYRALVTGPDGKRITKRFTDKQEAFDWIHQVQADISRESYIPSSDITLMEWVVKVIEVYKSPNVKRNTLNRYFYTADILVPIGHLRLQEITPFTIQKFYNNTLRDYSPSSIKKVHQLLNACAKKALASNLIGRNFMFDVQSPKSKKKTKSIEIYTDEELQIISEALDHSSTLYKAFKISLFTGMRLGEVCGLKVDRVYRDHIRVDNELQQVGKEIYDEEPKTANSVRDVPISKPIHTFLEDLVDNRVEGYVVVNNHGEPLRPKSAATQWSSFTKKHFGRGRRFHALRHTFATRLLSEGVPIGNVSRVLGHANVKITYECYVHAVPSLDSQIADMTSKLFKV